MSLTENIIEFLRITLKGVGCDNCGKMCLIRTTLYSLNMRINSIRNINHVSWTAFWGLWIVLISQFLDESWIGNHVLFPHTIFLIPWAPLTGKLMPCLCKPSILALRSRHLQATRDAVWSFQGREDLPGVKCPFCELCGDEELRRSDAMEGTNLDSVGLGDEAPLV